MTKIPLHTLEDIKHFSPSHSSTLYFYRLRVEDGWLYITTNRNGLSQTYIPDSEE